MDTESSENNDLVRARSSLLVCPILFWSIEDGNQWDEWFPMTVSCVVSIEFLSLPLVVPLVRGLIPPNIRKSPGSFLTPGAGGHVEAGILPTAGSLD